MSNGPLLSPTSSSSNDCIEIKFAGSGLKKDLKLGAVPLVSISRDYIKDNAGSFIGINNKINLNGKIYPRHHVLGTDNLINKEKDLRNLFSRSAGDIVIEASGIPLMSGINAKIISYNISPTSDNWTRSVDYSIELEYYETTDSNNYRVSSVEESWSIEPLEDLMYVNGLRYDYENFPQFRLTRKLSAVGVSSSGFVSHFDKKRQDDNQYNYISVVQQGSGDAYLEAKKWIDDRLKLPFDYNSNTDSKYTTLLSNSTVNGQFIPALSSNLFLYNHSRSINYSITEGSFEVNDSWMAMPSKRKYTEEFTIETSTDQKNIRTTRIQGSINGLRVDKVNIVSDKLLTPASSGKLELSQYQIVGEAEPPTIFENKYINAYSGWLYEVKPKIFNRASVAVSTRDRTLDYLPGTNGLLPPGNPVFRKERPLNPIPLSTSENHDPINGKIEYSYEYDNSFKIISGVVSESYKININGPADVFAEAFVLSRPIGPALQALDTKTATTKSVTIDLILVPPTGIEGFSLDDSRCPVWKNGYIFRECNNFISAQEPLGGSGQVFVKTDTYTWSPTEGRFSRSKEWIYQPCTKLNDVYQFFY
jgi:hypothetical protein